MKYSNDYVDSFNSARQELSKMATQASKQAQNNWRRRSDVEKNGVYAALTMLLLGSLLALIWTAGRRAGSHYVELPRHRDDKV